MSWVTCCRTCRGQSARCSKCVRTEAEVKSFLGLVTFSSRYIPDFSTVSEPLRRLLKTNEPFVWGEEQQESFDKLKSLLADADTLGYYDMNAKTQVITDASPVGLGAVLVQEQGEEYRVICYASRSLTDVERRYSQTEIALPGPVRGCIPICMGFSLSYLLTVSLRIHLLSQIKALCANRTLGLAYAALHIYCTVDTRKQQYR